MSQPRIDTDLELLREAEITAEQQTDVIAAVNNHVLPVANRVPLFARRAEEGVAWTGFQLNSGVLLATVTHFVYEQRAYREHAVSLGKPSTDIGGNFAVHEKELAVITDTASGEAWPRAHDFIIDDDTKTERRRGFPLLHKYAQLTDEALAALEASNKRNYEASTVSRQNTLRKRLEGYNRLRQAGFTGHGATAKVGEWALTLMQTHDPLDCLYIPNENYCEIGESDIRDLAKRAEACAQASVPSQTPPATFEGYDSRNMRAVQTSWSRLDDGRVRLTVRIEHTSSRTETFNIAPSSTHAHTATYTTNNFTNELFADINPNTIDAWVASKTNLPHPAGSTPLTRAHYRYLAGVLDNLRFDD